jgi:hypothetical protein
MVRLDWDLVQRGLLHRQAAIRWLTVLGVCLAVAIPIGAFLGLLGPMLGSAALLALVAAVLMLRSMMLGLSVLVSVICLLPFAALPINIGFSPTFLDLVLFALFFVWISRIVTHKEGAFQADSPTLGIVLFAALCLVSFVAGMAHSALSANVLRHFGEIVLSILVFLLVTNTVRTEKQLRLLTAILILAGGLAALIGVALYFLPPLWTIRILSVLRIVRYPSGSDVLRYIEDNPDLALRATSTSIDPNVLGGLLIFIGAITAPQVISPKPVLPRRISWMLLALVTLCLILTYSRSSFAGLLFAFFLLGVLRYPRLVLLGLLTLAVIYVLPPAQVYVQRFIEGVQGQDLATQMRFGEYRDALTLISRYPWFGVGFAGTPDIDTYLGVSNVYLLIAEETGIIGLTAFVVTLITFIARFARVAPLAATMPELDSLLLGPCLAVAGGMLAGFLDHYLFNLVFPHAAALLWFTLGLGVVAMRLVLARARQQAHPQSS